LRIGQKEGLQGDRLVLQEASEAFTAALAFTAAFSLSSIGYFAGNGGQMGLFTADDAADQSG
jgi:hypothetical protein